MNLGQIIKNYREQNHSSMETVAQLCGITKGYVAMLEKNVNPKNGRPLKPSIETITKVCNGLHLNIDDVFEQLDDDYVIALPTKNHKEDENMLLYYYNQLDPTQKESILTVIKSMIRS